MYAFLLSFPILFLGNGGLRLTFCGFFNSPLAPPRSLLRFGSLQQFRYVQPCPAPPRVLVLYGWIDGWMNGWMDGWTDGWMNELMDLLMYLSVCLTI